jgi:hypothetical protein
MHGLTWSELIELGAPKMEGQFLALRLMSNFIIKNFFLINYVFFLQRTKSVGLCGNMNGSMLDYARSVGLC